MTNQDPTRADDRAHEARLRRMAARQGLALRKSHLRGTPHVDDHAGHRIVDADRNSIVAGERFTLTLDEVEDFLAERER